MVNPLHLKSSAIYLLLIKLGIVQAILLLCFKMNFFMITQAHLHIEISKQI